MSRNRFTADADPVIAELYETAGDRLDIFAAEVGAWIGFYVDPTTAVLIEALRALPLEMSDAIAQGEARSRLPTHTTPAFFAPRV